MAPEEPEIRKQAATGTTRHITFTVPETLEIIRKPGNAHKPECHYGSIQDWIVDHLRYNKTQENITYKNLGW